MGQDGNNINVGVVVHRHESCNPFEAANDRLAAQAKEALRCFVAAGRGIQPSEVIFPDIADAERFVELLTALRHLARHLAVIYPRADKLARRRHQRQYDQETSWQSEVR